MPLLLKLDMVGWIKQSIEDSSIVRMVDLNIVRVGVVNCYIAGGWWALCMCCSRTTHPLHACISHIPAINIEIQIAACRTMR